MEWEIRKYDVDRSKSKWVTEEPTVGKWYVGANMEPGGTFVYGELAEYVGEGEFVDDFGEPCDMRECEYLVEQPSGRAAESFNGSEE